MKRQGLLRVKLSIIGIIIILATYTFNVSPVYASLTNFFNQVYTGTRTDWTGNVGYEFIPSQDITVTALGRPVSTSMNGNHDVKIWRVSDTTCIASVIVTPSSATDVLGYKYEPLGSSVTLTSGTAYRITSFETANGDAWREIDSRSNHCSIGSISLGIYSNDGTSSTTYPNMTWGSSEQGFCAPTFYTGTAPTPSDSLTNFFKQVYTGTRTDWTGNVGYEFTPSQNITVTALGRPVSTGMNGNHDVKIWRVSDTTCIASVTVTPSSATDVLGYKYEPLGSSVTLTSGTAYRITSFETSASGDAWRNIDSRSNHSSIGSISLGIYSNNGTSSTTYPNMTWGSSEQGFCAPTFYTGTAPTPTPDPAIQTVVNQVSQSQLYAYDNVLSNVYGARVSGSSLVNSVNWTKAKLESFGLTVETDDVSGSDAPNLIAKKIGTTNPGRIWVVGAHIDTVSNSPGAWDNGCGTAIVLHCAELLSQQQFADTVYFAIWVKEESGMLGSSDWVNNHAVPQGLNIQGNLNFDGLGYEDSTPEAVDILVNSGSASFGQQFVQAAQTYTSLKTNLWTPTGSVSSDQSSFWNAGYKAFDVIDDFPVVYPWYHGSGDTIDHLNFSYVADITKGAVAALCNLAGLQ